jgi:CPA1 family monovalent cation:H+ antiporter
VPHVELIIGLVLAAAVLAGLARVLGVPYPVVLVLGGLAFGFVPGLPSPRLEPDLVFLIFLPPLVYSAALQSSTQELRANARPIGVLSTGLVVATMLWVAVAAHAAAGLAWGPAFVLGAVLGPTDPVAATAILRRLGAPDRIATILEGEALINDGTGLTVYKIAVSAAVGGSFALAEGVGRFVLIAAGGVAIGVAAGWLSTEIRRRIDEPTIEASVSLLTAFLAYLPAERVGASGILAAVAAGLYVGQRSGEVLSPATRLQTRAFWEVVTFLLDSVLFLLVGLQFPDIVNAVQLGSPSAAIGQVLAVVGALAAVRLAWMFAAAGAVRIFDPERGRPERGLSRGEQLVLGVTGMRGAISLAAALAIPLHAHGGLPFHDRDEVIFLTYCAILTTLVLPALTLPALLRQLGLAEPETLHREEQAALLQLAQAALARLEQAAEQHEAPDTAIEQLRRRYEARIQRLEPLIDGGTTSDPADDPGAWIALRHAAISAERERLYQLRRDGKISEEAMRHLRRDLDLEEARLTHTHG